MATREPDRTVGHNPADAPSRTAASAARRAIRPGSAPAVAQNAARKAVLGPFGLSVVTHGIVIAAVAGTVFIPGRERSQASIDVRFAAVEEPITLLENDFQYDAPIPEPEIEDPRLSPFEEPVVEPLPDDPAPDPFASAEASRVEPPPVPRDTWFGALRPRYAPESEDVSDEPAPEAEPTPPPAPVVVEAPASTGFQPATALATNPEPSYPAAARRRGHEGLAVVRVRISSGGEALSTEIARSSGHRSLDYAALETVRRWRFAPASLDGRPVEDELDVNVRFALVD